MAKNLTSLFLTVLLIYHAPLTVAADIAATPAPAPNPAGAADWKPVLTQLGVEPGNSMTPDAYALLVKKLAGLPQMGLKIRESSPRPIPLADWIRILKGLGIQPKPNMSEQEWALILDHAGIDVSKGASATLVAPAVHPLISRAAVSTAPQATTIPKIAVSMAAPAAVVSSTHAVVSAIGPGVFSGVQANSSPASAMPGPVMPPPRGMAVTAVGPVSAIPAPQMPNLPAGVIPARVESSMPAAIQPSAAETKTISKRLNLEFKGIDIGEALKVIARQGNFSLVVNSGVRGNVTLYLKDVELWQGLRIVLESADLAYAYDGNVVHVMSAADYEKLYGTRFDDKTTLETLSLKYVKASAAAKYLESIKSHIGKILVYDLSNALILSDTPETLARMKQVVQSLDQPLVTTIFEVNYAKMEDLVTKLTPMVTKDIGDIQTDKRTNQIVITDYADRLRPMAQLIRVFDEPERAVLIDSKIVDVTISNENQMGVNWGYIFSQLGRYAIPGGITGNFTLLPVTAPGTPTNGPGTAGPGAAGPIGVTASLGTLSTNNYTALIQALQTFGKTDLIASPRISVINNETANILVGTKEAYVTTTVTTPGVGPETTAEQVNFVDVGVKLHVTPIIGADGYINLKIKPEVSDVDHTLTTAEGNTIPIVRTSEAETTVLVKDGETMLLAGLIQNQVTKTDIGVPILSRIPLFGLLFRSSDHTVAKTELAVFLTPHIQAASSEKQAALDRGRTETAIDAGFSDR